MFTDEFDADRKSAWRNCGAVNDQRTIPPRPCGIGRRWTMVYESDTLPRIQPCSPFTFRRHGKIEEVSFSPFVCPAFLPAAFVCIRSVRERIRLIQSAEVCLMGRGRLSDLGGQDRQVRSSPVVASVGNSDSSR
jgi:hypothetical protein